MIRINHSDLPESTLDNILEEVVTREGTDYGIAEVSLETKKEQLKLKLTSGQAALVFYEHEELCDIIAVQ